ncbi:response regulator [Desulfococcaceae bacterium HSG9]|nr:response regulator [Desulfococcaceae bacterium HSG9]
MKTILILDDEQAVRDSFADYFEDRLWQTIQVESAEEALELLETESPDAAIVDVRLPGMDGNDFIRKAYRRSPKTVFVICSGSPEYLVPADLMKLSCVSNHLFKKPVTRMADLEKEVFQMIEYMHEKENKNE